VVVAASLHGAEPDIASASFDDGTPGPFETIGPITFPADPTGSGRGRIAQMRYADSATRVDITTSLVYRPRRDFGYGSTFFFGGDFYIPAGVFNFDNPKVDRELLEFRGTTGDSTYHPTAGIVVIVHYWGFCGVQLEWSHDSKMAASSCGHGVVRMARWHRIETEVRLNTNGSASDGILRLWFDGTLTFEDSTIRFTDPAWLGPARWGSWSIGSRRRSSDFDGMTDLTDTGKIDELRYWDNVAFSTTRVGASR
jgi:hypothetical protein